MPTILGNLGDHFQAAEDGDCSCLSYLYNLGWQHPLHSQVGRGCMAAGGLQQRKDFHVVAPVVTIVGWEPMGVARQEA